MRAASLALLVFAFAAARAEAAPARWVLASIAPEDSPSGQLARRMGALFERNAPGELVFKWRLGGVLGDEADTVAMCRRGEIAAFAGSMGAVAAVVPEIELLEQPYLFPDLETFQAARRAIERLPQFQAYFHKRDLVLLGMVAIGWRNIFSVKRPVHSVSDLRGMRVRTQPGALHTEIWKAFGAEPRAIPLTELNTALEVGHVEAFDVPANFAYATSLDSKAHHYTLSRHLLQIAMFVVNKKAWDALSHASRVRLTDGLEAIVVASEKQHMAFDDELLGHLRKGGAAIYVPSAAELATFREASGGIGEYLRRRATKAERVLFDGVRQVVKGARKP